MDACAACIEASRARALRIGELEAGDATPETVRRALREFSQDSPAERTIGAGTDQGEVWSVCRHDPRYPATLENFQQQSDVPSVIHGVGEQQVLVRHDAARTVALVGARRATAYGREVAYSLARDCAQAGLTVVSGMALGIDGAAHRGALQGGGNTIAVLAGGPETPYPRSHRLLHEQIQASGCVISEAPPGTTARRWGFVARNRIIAALAAVTVFVEGTEASGARHTVDFARDLGSTVAVVPGPVTSPLSAGPNALLAEASAAVVRDIDDLLAELGLEPQATPSLLETAASGSLEQVVLTEIAAGAHHPREIAAALDGVAAQDLTRLLGLLELEGKICRNADGGWVTTQGGRSVRPGPAH